MLEVYSSYLQCLPRKQHHDGVGGSSMVKLKTMTTEGIHGGTCEEFLEWEIKAVSHDRTGKYEVAPKSAVFKGLEPEYR